MKNSNLIFKVKTNQDDAVGATLGRNIIKIILVILLLFFPSISLAMEGEMYFGYFFDVKPSVNSKKAQPNTEKIAQYIYGIELNEKVRFLNIYGGISTLMDEQKGVFFHPASVSYKVGTSVDIKNITISLEHQCWHPIDTLAENHKDVEVYNQIMMRYKF